MVKRKGLIVTGVILLVLAGVLIYFSFFYSPQKDFTRTSLVRLNIPLGGEINSTLKIINPDDRIQEIKFSLNNFDGLASLSTDKFIFDSKEETNLIIYFKDSINKPGIYVGKLTIEGSLYKEEIPIILGVEDPNHAFAIVQTSVPKYDSVYPGGKLGIDFKVFDLVNSNVQTVKTNYLIKNLDDETILNGNTDLVVGSGSKTEIVNIPNDWEIGDYVFISYIDFKDTISFSSYLFSVSNPEGKDIFGNLDLFVVGIVIFIVFILIMVIYFVKTRDSLLVQLKKQQDAEIKRNLCYINHSKKVISVSKEKPEKKKIKLQKIEKVKKNVINKIKKKQKKQKNEISKLKKSKVHKNVLKSKLDKWKKEGYKMYETDGEMKKISNKGVKNQIREWNRQGYDTGFLKK
jgi:hypothetical protein